MSFNKLTENIFYIDYDRNFDRPNLAYIKGEKFSVAIDAGTSYKHVEMFYSYLAENNLPKPKYTIITHWHWDHTFGMNSVSGETIAHKNTNKKLSEMANWEWTEEAMKKRLLDKTEIEFADVYIKKEFPDLSKIKIVKADIEFEKSMKIDLGKISAEIFYTASPHSDDSIFIYIPEEKVLFVGDSICIDFYNNNYLDRNILTEMKKIIENIDFKWCILGHTEPLSKEDTLKEIDNLMNSEF